MCACDGLLPVGDGISAVSQSSGGGGDHDERHDDHQQPSLFSKVRAWYAVHLLHGFLLPKFLLELEEAKVSPRHFWVWWSVVEREGRVGTPVHSSPK